MNKNILTEKYYSHLREQAAGAAPAAGGGLVDALGKVGMAGVVLYGLNRFLDFGTDMIKAGARGGESSTSSLGDTGRSTKGGIDRIQNMVLQPGENAADEYQNRLLNMYGDKDLQGMSTSKRNTILGREQSIAANINKKRMQSARAQLMDTPEIASARKAYEDARKSAPKPQSGLTPEQMLKQKSDPTVKAAYERLKAAEAQALGKTSPTPPKPRGFFDTLGDMFDNATGALGIDGGKKEKEDARAKLRDEYNAARSGYLATRRETSPMATYTKDYSGFSVGSGVGGKPIITGGSYVDPNSPAGRIEASIASGDEKDMARTPAGRLQSGKKMDWEYEEDSMKAREKALGFNPRGMTDDQIRRRMEQLSREKVDADSAKIKAEVDAMTPEELNVSVIRSTASGPLANEYLDILRKQNETPDQRKKREDQELIRSASAARGKKDFGTMGRPTPETPDQRKKREDQELIRSASAARGKKDFGTMGRPTPATPAELQKRAEIEAGEQTLRDMEMYKGQVEADRIRRQTKTKEAEIEAGEQTLRDMQMYKGQVEADRIRREEDMRKVPELLQKPEPWSIVKQAEIDAGEQTLRDMQMYKGQVEADRIRRQTKTKVANLIANRMKSKATEQNKGKAFPKSPDYPTPETTAERNARIRKASASRPESERRFGNMGRPTPL